MSSFLLQLFYLREAVHTSLFTFTMQDDQSESSDKEDDGLDIKSALYSDPRGGNR